jgi:hypothetical protein
MNEFDKKVILSKIDEIDFNNEDDKLLKIVAKSKLPITWRWNTHGFWQGITGWCYWEMPEFKGYPRGKHDKKLTKEILIELLKG